MSRRLSLLLMICAVGGLLLASCSGDDDSVGSATSSTETSTTERATSTSTTTSAAATTTTTEPPATDASAVRPYLESLIDRYDVAVAAILADPRVAADRDHESVTEYLDLFTPSSSFPDTALQFWADEGSQGRFYRAGPRGQMYESSVQSIEVGSPDQVTFVVCSQKSIVIVDDEGNELSAEGGSSSGSVVAVRVDGSWRLRDLTRTTSSSCEADGAQP